MILEVSHKHHCKVDKNFNSTITSDFRVLRNCMKRSNVHYKMKFSLITLCIGIKFHFMPQNV